MWNENETNNSRDENLTNLILFLNLHGKTQSRYFYRKCAHIEHGCPMKMKRFNFLSDLVLFWLGWFDN